MGFLYGESAAPKDICTFSALFSCTLSMWVMITCVIFPRIRTKMFMRVIFYISLSCFIGNATVFSKAPSNYYLCYFQGLLQQFFYPASWLWTTILTYLLYSLVILKKIDLEWWKMHAIGWGIPILITFVPLSTDSYGIEPDDDDWCWLHPQHNNIRGRAMNQFWHLATFTALIFGCFAAMLFFGFLIYWDIYVRKEQHSKHVLSALNILMYYPLSLFITWFPNAIMDAFDDANLSQSGPVMIFINSLSLWHGGFIAIIFFVKSREVRHHWLVLINSVFGDVFKVETSGGIMHGTRQDRDSEMADFSENQKHDKSHIVSDFENDEIYQGMGHDEIVSHEISVEAKRISTRWFQSENRNDIFRSSSHDKPHISMSSITFPSRSTSVTVNNPLAYRANNNIENVCIETAPIRALEPARQSTASESAMDGIVDI
jgi:hypothetical protein